MLRGFWDGVSSFYIRYYLWLMGCFIIFKIFFVKEGFSFLLEALCTFLISWLGVGVFFNV